MTPLSLEASTSPWRCTVMAVRKRGGPAPGGGPHVRLSPVQRTSQFMAYDSNFTGGVNVAMGDVNDSGNVGILTGRVPAWTAGTNVYANGPCSVPFRPLLPVFRRHNNGCCSFQLVVARQSQSTPCFRRNRSEPGYLHQSHTTFTRPIIVTFGQSNYVGPFAILDASSGPITLAPSRISGQRDHHAGRGGVTIGDQAILALCDGS